MKIFNKFLFIIVLCLIVILLLVNHITLANSLKDDTVYLFYKTTMEEVLLIFDNIDLLINTESVNDTALIEYLNKCTVRLSSIGNNLNIIAKDNPSFNVQIASLQSYIHFLSCYVTEDGVVHNDDKDYLVSINSLLRSVFPSVHMNDGNIKWCYYAKLVTKSGTYSNDFKNRRTIFSKLELSKDVKKAFDDIARLAIEAANTSPIRYTN